jgi:TonB family protein
LVLASDEDGGTLQTLQFSLASDIVELLVLTSDQGFLQTLRDAVGGARRLWHVMSADKVSDLLVAGEVGIVVLDTQALHEAPSVFVAQIKRQFPDLVVVAAGHRDDETSLAGLISAGLVYRFIHKPMSPARAKLFAEAAIKKFEDQQRQAATAPEYKRAASSRRSRLIGGAAGALVLMGAIAWMVHRSGGEDTAAARTGEAVNDPVESPLLARAAAALAANKLTEPPGDNALELYSGLQARYPADADARAGLTEVHERLLARAENALLEERLDEAAAAIETARNSGVESGRVAFLSARLAKSREQIKAVQERVLQQSRARAAPKAEEIPVAPLPTLAAQSNAAQPNAAQSNAAQSNAAQPNAAQPNTDQHALEPARDTDADADSSAQLQKNAAEVSSAQQDLDADLAKQNFMRNLVPAGQLTLLKTVQPAYPIKAQNSKVEGWVDLEFTVSETGKVQDVTVRATSVPGVFEDAAVKAVNQWRYRPNLRDAKPVPVRTQIRLRFTLS